MLFPHLYGDGLVAKSCPTLATAWTVACQASLSKDSPGKTTGVPFRSPGDLSHSGNKPESPALQADRLFTN